MDDHSQTSFTSLLARAREGDSSVVGVLFSLVYEQLRNIARTQRRDRAEQTLNTTALVHEVYLKVAQQQSLDIRDRAHFMAVVAKAMRHILIDHARGRLRAKRGSGAVAISFDEIEAAFDAGSGFTDEQAGPLIALDDAVKRLARISERQSQVVECRFFAGLSIEETAQALDTSPATVKRDWRMAQAWLYRELKEQ